MKSVRANWDENFAYWFVGEIFTLVIMGISSAYGGAGYIIAAIAFCLLIAAEIKRPRKYYCKTCKEYFVLYPSKGNEA